MSLPFPEVGELFLYRVQSYHTLNPSQKWSNNYAFITILGSGSIELRAVALDLIDFHSKMTMTNIITERCVVSTYIPDTNPYDANEFLTVEAPTAGTVDNGGSEQIPLETCLYLRKETQFGRVGKIFLRGALSEQDVSFGQSLFTPTTATLLGTRLAAAVISSGLSLRLGTEDTIFSMCMPDNTPPNTGARIVDTLSIGGIRNVNMNKRYYNRATL